MKQMQKIVRSAPSILVTGLICGLIVGFLLPRSWLFQDRAYDSNHQENPGQDESWACPMLCVVLDHPGQCPVCGMELEPFIAAGDEVVLSRHDQEMIGLTTGEATIRNLFTDLRTPGLIEFDETGFYSVTAWTGGRLDLLYVEQQGESVSAGEALAEIYSPEVYVAKQELLALSRAEGNGRDSGINLATEKLRLLGVPEYEIDQILETGLIRTGSIVVSPASGTVTSVLVREGEYVSSGQILMELADIETVWLTLYLTEDQFGLVNPGQELEFRIDAEPEMLFSGSVETVDPFMDHQGGTFEARVLVENSSRRFLPGQSAAVSLISREYPGTVLSVPRESVLQLGSRSVVYVLTGPTVYEVSDDGSMRVEEARFEPRPVTVGPTASDSTGTIFYPVYSGLSEGDIVALDGAFLIDSQAELLGLPSLLSVSTLE